MPQAAKSVSWRCLSRGRPGHVQPRSGPAAGPAHCRRSDRGRRPALL